VVAGSWLGLSLLWWSADTVAVIGGVCSCPCGGGWCRLVANNESPTCFREGMFGCECTLPLFGIRISVWFNPLFGIMLSKFYSWAESKPTRIQPKFESGPSSKLGRLYRIRLKHSPAWSSQLRLGP
jgi:hypothetical protein